jgi:hypothetical protein
VAEALSETFTAVETDETYRRQQRYVVVATVESLVPLGTTLDPSIWGGGSSEYTWGRVRRFFTRLPQARRRQLPMHYYAEYLRDDYVVYVGCPETNKSWFLQDAVAHGALRPEYLDSLLVVVQDNYGVEVVERQLWRVLAHQLLTPILRREGLNRDRVRFFELEADTAVLADPALWPYEHRRPAFLDPLQLELQLKHYQKA